MEFQPMQPPEPEQVPDTVYPINFNGEKQYYFTERWDRLVTFRELGAWCLKIFDDEDGLVEGWIEQSEAQRVIEHTGTEPHIKEKMTESEYKAYKQSGLS